MNIKTYLLNLEKRKVISRWPPPARPFIISLIYLILAKITESLNYNSLKTISLILAVFSFVFAILHLIVVMTLNKKVK